MTTKTQSIIQYRLIECGLCHHLFEWPGTRMPNYCPECGNHIYMDYINILYFDSHARLEIHRYEHE